MSDDSWVEKLKAELASEHCDSEVVRLLCRNHTLPADLRGAVWKCVLGVNQKPDLLAGVDDGTLQREEAEETLLTLDSQVIANGDKTKSAVLERVLKFYCQARTLPYTHERRWAHMVWPLVDLGLSDGVVYNCFYTILSTYVPRHCAEPGSLPFSVLRLLLMYHDPEVCVHLDSLKVSPELYAAHWLEALFSANCSVEVIRAIWDSYFVEADSFLVFFLSLVIIINFREVILETKAKEALLQLLPNVPSQLQVDDIPDFCAVARHYGTLTPPSFCKHVYNALFSAREYVQPIPLCLTVTAKEVAGFLSLATGTQKPVIPFKYLVVDCRSVYFRQSVGYHQQTVHIDPMLMLEDPPAFEAALKSLDSAEALHLVFVGTDNEDDDQYMHMVVARLLQHHRKHLSILVGGYAALAEQSDASDLVAPVRKTKKTTPTVVQSEATVAPASPSKTAALFGSWSSYLKEKTSSLKEDFVKMVVNDPQQLQRQHQNAIQSPATYSNTKQTGSKASEFSIDDDESSSASHAKARSKPVVELNEDLSGCESVDLDSWISSENAELVFPCNEVDSIGHMRPSYLVVRAADLVVLRGRPDKVGSAYLLQTRPLILCSKITQKKRHPNLVTFTFRDSQDSEMKTALRFLVPEAHRCAGAVKDKILLLRGIEDQEDPVPELEKGTGR